MRRRFNIVKMLILAGLATVLVVNLWHRVTEPSPALTAPAPLDPAFIRLSPLEIAALPVAVRWDAPLGSEHGALTYNAQPFRVTRHLGDDLNGIGGYNSDLGDPVYAAAAGRVVFAGVPGTGWGNMVILAHRVPNARTGALEVVQSMYAHLQDVLARPGQMLRRGEELGTVGTAGGLYFAHLHFETRQGPYVNPSVGYADAPLNRMSPEAFVAQHRGAEAGLLNPAPR
ncbi:MAG: Peptidase [Verrucomicrobiaceae bacterium]|nr:Peptidase [Verrucomicrobiaceae bacterium]